MADAHEFLKTLTIVLGTAAFTTVLFQRLRQPVVLGYLASGMIVGPHVPIPLHADEATTRTLSELGVILLMFSIGLELSLGKLLRVGLRAAFIAVVQCSLMIWLGAAVGHAFGWTSLESLYAGGIIAVSSTTIIVKAFEDAKIKGRFKETVFGVLIVEDLIAIVLMTVFTTLSSGASLSAAGLAMTAGRLAAFLIALLVAGLLLIPRIIRFTVRQKSPETTVVAAVGICFACALLASSFGYSVALGAFVAGSLIAESGEAKEVEHVTVPVRDVFGAIFFVSVGMLIDPRLIAQNWLAVIVLTLAVVLGKIVFVTLSAFLTGAGIRPSVQAGMSLAQIGEFSFIIAGLGISMGATRNFLYPVAVAVSAITTLLTPWLIRAAGPAAARLDSALPDRLQTVVALYSSWLERVGSGGGGESRPLRRTFGVLLLDAVALAGVIIGGSLASDRLGSAVVERAGLSLRAAHAIVLAAFALLGAPFLIGAVRSARRLGFLLATSALPPAPGKKIDLALAPRRALIVMLELAIVVLLGAPLLALTQPFLPPFYGVPLFIALLILFAVLFWRSAADLEGHVKAAAVAIAEALADQARKGAPDKQPALEEVRAHLPGLGAMVTLRLGDGSHAIGKSLAELNLRGLTGATVLAVDRPGGALQVPSAQERLAKDDLLVLSGTEEEIGAGVGLLERGESPA